VRWEDKIILSLSKGVFLGGLEGLIFIGDGNYLKGFFLGGMGGKS
jgi:hypothetical protein